MHLLPHDERLLHRAIDLAANAVGLASPNPTVGCVLTRGDTLLSEGAHLYDNYDHAEIAALKQAVELGQNVQGATAYVTLEPCAHHGRTGPCSEALIAAGIARCVIATIDPNPLTRGQGIAKMQAAGIEVLLADPTSSLALEARRLNDAFAFAIQHHRPFVTLKAALSVDGKLAPPASARTSIAPHWLTGEAARADTQHLRHAADAILTGIGTVLADNPSLTDRTGLPRRRPMLRVILDSHLRTPLASNLITNHQNRVLSTEARSVQRRDLQSSQDAKDLLILCADTAPLDREQALTTQGAEVLRLPSDNHHLDLNALLTELASRKILSLLLEAGSALNGAFLAANLVDKLVLYYAESELGLDALPFAQGIASPYVLQQSLIHTTRTTFPHGDGEDVRITGYLHDPWQSI